ncbi:TVP38/TMEM64 family protein [Gordonia sinesedis]
MSEPDSPPVPGRTQAAVRLGLFVAFLGLMFYLVVVARVVDVGAVREFVRAAGPAAPFAYVPISALLGALFVPGPILAAGSGLLFGPLVGTLVTLGATVGTAVIACFLGRRAGRGSVRDLLGAGRADVLDRQIERYGLWAVVGQRFVPGIPDAPVAYAYGAFGIPLWQMAVGAFIGSAPRAFVYTALGASIGEKSAPLAYAAIGVWCVMAVVGALAAHRGYRTWRGHRRRRRADPQVADASSASQSAAVRATLDPSAVVSDASPASWSRATKSTGSTASNRVSG